MRLRNWLVVAVAVVAALLLAGRAVTALVVEHAWFSALDASGVFWEQLSDSLLLQGGAWLLGSVFAFANLHAVRRTISAVAVPSRVANIELTEVIPARRLLSITIVLSALIGFALALPLNDWTLVALARHGISFGEIEGILGRDLGFYVYLLPLEETAYLWALGTLIVVVASILILYAVTRSLRLDGRRIIASTHVRRHLSVLGALVLVLLAWSYRLDTFDLLQRGTGPEGQFLRIDHVVSLQADRVLVILCVIAAPILLRSGWLGQLRSAFITLTLVLGAALGGRQILPILLARSDVIGEPAKRDRAYVASRTLYSRRAYDADGLLTQPLPDSGTAGAHAAAKARVRLTLTDAPALVSLWEPDAARVHANDGRNAQLDAGPAGWSRTADGHIAALLIRRPVSGSDRWSVAIADVTQPLLRDSVLDIAIGARGEDREDASEPISAPGLRGHKLVIDPAGVRGTPLRSLGLRIAHAWAMRDPGLMDADTVAGAAPRLVAYRDVRERITRLAPVFAQGEEVQPVLVEGTIIWALSLYSASNHYPLSQHWTLAGEERSYFRLAATALVDANTGRVRLVPVERPDALARTWLELFPSLVVRPRDLPVSLLDQLPPATDGAIAQLRTFARYGSRLEGAVLRHLPDSALAGSTPPVHLVPTSAGTAPAWSVPMLDGNDQIDGVISAVGGRFRATYWDSTTVPRARWSTQTDRIRAALDTARASLSELSRREPRVRVGRVQVLPGEGGPILIQSLFWNRADGAPIVSRVAVSDGAHLALGGSVAEAVASLRGLPASPARSLEWLPTGGAARDEQVARLYEVMREAMRRGEWTRFGAAFDSLGLVLGKPPR